MSDDDKPGLRLFQGYGIELEYMIVDDERLDVHPISDRVLLDTRGRVMSEIENGDIAWSNELTLHVIELKTNGPAARLDGLAARFQDNVAAIEALLSPHGARLLPTAMHPWMDPATETRLWPHEYGAVYDLFDSMFDCRGHGWSNLQSMHINLPFTGDEELWRLHTAIRLILPALPGLAASSPAAEGRITGLADTRLEYYRHNCRSLPCVTGRVVPEQIDGEASYRRIILHPIARAVAPHDRAGIADPEWVNARGAIVRFVRDSIEIRVIDVQEHPAADLAIAELVVAVLRRLTEEGWCGTEEQGRLHEAGLEELLLEAIRHGDRARVTDADYLRCFGMGAPCTLGELWAHLAESCLAAPVAAPLQTILEHGTLSRRILTALGGDERALFEVYRTLADCLRRGESFEP